MCLHIPEVIPNSLHMADAISEGTKQSGDPELACVEAQRSGREEGMCLHIPEVIPNSLRMCGSPRLTYKFFFENQVWIICIQFHQSFTDCSEICTRGTSDFLF